MPSIENVKFDEMFEAGKETGMFELIPQEVAIGSKSMKTEKLRHRNATQSKFKKEERPS